MMFTFEGFYLMLMDYFSLDSSHLYKKLLQYVLKASLSINLVNFSNDSFRTYHISPLSSAALSPRSEYLAKLQELPLFFLRLFIYFERGRETDRQTDSTSGGGAEKEGEIIQSRFHAVSTEAGAGIEFTNCENMKSRFRCLTD